MKVENITLSSGLLVVRPPAAQTETDSGIIIPDSHIDAEFIINGEVVSSGAKDYKVGTYVIYHILDCEAFRDDKEEYHLLKEDKIKGVYARED